jgi:hypothetical protein
MSKRQVTFLVGANAEQFVKSMKRVEKDMDALAKRADKVGRSMSKMFTAPILAASAALVGASIQAAKFADEIDKMSIRTGVSREQLQELKFVTDQVGVSFGAVESAADAFRRKLPEIDKGTGQTADTMARLGVSVRGADGQLKSMDALFPELIRSLARVQNQTDRSTMAMQLFGRGASQLAPLMDLGADGIDKLSGKAHELGLVMDDTAIKSLVEFNDMMSEVKMQGEAVGREFGMILVPILRDELLPLIQNKIIPAVRKAAKQFADMDAEGKKQILMYAAIIAAAGPAVIILGNLARAVAGLATAMRLLVGINPYTAIGIAVAALAVHYVNLFREAKKAHDLLREPISPDMGIDAQITLTVAKVNELAARIAELRKSGPRVSMGIVDTAGFQANLKSLQERFEQERDTLAQLEAQRRATNVTIGETTTAIQQEARAWAYLGAVRADATSIDPRKAAMFFTDEEIARAERMGNSMDALAGRLRLVKVEGGQMPEVMTNFQLRTEQVFAALNPLVDTFVNSFGAGMANIAVQGENLQKTLQNIGKLLQSAVIQTGIRLLLLGGLPGSGFLAQGGGLFGFLKNAITPTNAGSVIASAAAFGPASVGSGGGGKGNIRVTGVLVGQGSQLNSVVTNSNRVFR